MPFHRRVERLRACEFDTHRVKRQPSSNAVEFAPERPLAPFTRSLRLMTGLSVALR